MDRLAMLEKMVASGANDPFVRYGLAMEYRRLGQLERATSAFDELLTGHPDYLAAYLMAGGVLVALQRKEQAKALYVRGMALARQQGNSKTLDELESAHAELADDDA